MRTFYSHICQIHYWRLEYRAGWSLSAIFHIYSSLCVDEGHHSTYFMDTHGAMWLRVSILHISWALMPSCSRGSAPHSHSKSLTLFFSLLCLFYINVSSAGLYSCPYSLFLISHRLLISMNQKKKTSFYVRHQSLEEPHLSLCSAGLRSSCLCYTSPISDLRLQSAGIFDPIPFNAFKTYALIISRKQDDFQPPLIFNNPPVAPIITSRFWFWP